MNKILGKAEENAGEFTFGGLARVLPAVPGLFVDTLGEIPVPLTEEYAVKLIAKCEKSPFGHNFDTKMDDNVRKSWQLNPEQVKFENPMWHSGINSLTETIAHQLGYEGVPMQCALYKLLVYGEGGHFLKHQDTEKEDRMVATLVVQLPSLHEGGDLLVYRSGEVKYRHDFGKADGMAAYFPHYAVHYADAEHSLEKVTKGYRLVLVYSLCLPVKWRHEKITPAHSLSCELSSAISRMEPKDDCFALFLAHEYTEKSVVDLGCHAMKGIDRARFQALEEANTIVPTDKKLQFYIAQLNQQIVYYESNYENEKWEEDSPRKESITWYSTSGMSFGEVNWTVDEAQEKREFNYLNPGHESYCGLWRAYGTSKEEGFTGNEGPTKNTTYSRYAIVGWPAAQGVANAFKFINANAALWVLEKQKPVDAATLRRFFNRRPTSVSAWFCQTVCNIFCRLSEQTEVIPSVVSLVKRFEWGDIGEAGLNSLSEADDQKAMSVALQVADGLETGAAQVALLKCAVEKGSKLENEALFSSDSVELLWNQAICCDDPSIFDTVAKKFKAMDGSSLGPAVEAFSVHLGSMEQTDSKFSVLKSIAAKRIEWLKSQIDSLDLPFSWKMPDAKFPDNAKIQEFCVAPLCP